MVYILLMKIGSDFVIPFFVFEDEKIENILIKIENKLDQKLDFKKYENGAEIWKADDSKNFEIKWVLYRMEINK